MAASRSLHWCQKWDLAAEMDELDHQIRRLGRDRIQRRGSDPREEGTERYACPSLPDGASQPRARLASEDTRERRRQQNDGSGQEREDDGRQQRDGGGLPGERDSVDGDDGEHQSPTLQRRSRLGAVRGTAGGGSQALRLGPGDDRYPVMLSPGGQGATSTGGSAGRRARGPGSAQRHDPSNANSSPAIKRENAGKRREAGLTTLSQAVEEAERAELILKDPRPASCYLVEAEVADEVRAARVHTAEASPRTLRCWRCKRRGHKASQCRATEPAGNTPLTEIVVGRLGTSNGLWLRCVIQGLPVTALVDTGATVSLLQTGLAAKLKSSPSSTWEETDVLLRSVTGEEIHMRGKKRLQVELALIDIPTASLRVGKSRIPLAKQQASSPGVVASAASKASRRSRVSGCGRSSKRT
ncbi:hypothetical protein NFI96_025060 [Prochilodus magdalenae]|nr:hypothetical protein NFI96_025060 [Prochilodus magdalenae]